MSKRERLLDAFNNKPVDRVPVGFWFHFLEEEEFGQALEREELVVKNIESHKRYIDAVDPDFVKIMSDGYFHYPSEVLNDLKSAKELRDLKPIGKDHPWIQGQVKIAKEVNKFLSDTSSFYNIFSPASLLRFTISNKKFIELFKEDADSVFYALDVIAHDLGVLAEAVISEGKAEGIYLSVQNPENSSFTFREYREYITPSEKYVLKKANEIRENNILHCCGYDGNRNDLNLWTDYDAKAINWAVTIENVSLKDGKKAFGDKAVIGGFDSRSNSLIHVGSKDEIQSFTENIIKGAGNLGVIIGADCTLPRDIELERIKWVKDKVKELTNA